MSEFTIRSESVDVEQIMKQIRARILEKRGADYTEQEIQELASVKLEKFLDPRGVRSNLVEDFRRNRVVSPDPKKLETGEIDIYGAQLIGAPVDAEGVQVKLLAIASVDACTRVRTN